MYSQAIEFKRNMGVKSVMLLIDASIKRHNWDGGSGVSLFSFREEVTVM